MPGRGTPPRRLSVGSLWMAIFTWPTFGGLLLGATLVGTPTGGEWAQVWAVLVVGGFFGLSATCLGVVYLSELARRRERAPADRARRFLLAVALTVLCMAAGVAIDFAAVGVGQLPGLANAPVLSGALIGGLSGGVVVLFYQIGRRLARKPPSQGHGGTEPSPPADRPLEADRGG